MAWIVAIIIGGVIGFMAGLILRTKESLTGDLLIGILGSVIGLWFFTDVLSMGPSAQDGALSIINILWSIVGAILLVAFIETVSSEPKKDMKMYETPLEKATAHEYKKTTRNQKLKNKI